MKPRRCNGAAMALLELLDLPLTVLPAVVFPFGDEGPVALAGATGRKPTSSQIPAWNGRIAYRRYTGGKLPKSHPRAGQIRNPRAEIRRKSENRRPKGAAGDGLAACRSGSGFGSRISDFLRASGFGLRISRPVAAFNPQPTVLQSSVLSRSKVTAERGGSRRFGTARADGLTRRCRGWRFRPGGLR